MGYKQSFFFRGLTIRNAAQQKRNQQKKINAIKQDLKKEEERLQEIPTNQGIYERIKRLQHEIRKLQTERKKLKITRQYFFENANKEGRWLAYRLKKDRQRNYIQKCKNKKGEEELRLEGMKEIIENFYKSVQEMFLYR